MTGVDHHRWRQAGLLQHGAGGLDARRVIVRCLAAAQDDVAVAVSGGGGDRGAAGLGHGQEMVRLRGRLYRIDRDLDVAVGAVLEADRAGEAGGQFAVSLALGRARADRAPGH